MPPEGLRQGLERRPGVLVAPDGGLSLTWDVEGVSERAFVTRAYWRGRAVDQLQVHLLGASGTYRIEMVCFDGEGNMLGEMAGSVETFSPFPTFGIVRPAVPNTRVNCSPYGQSVFADAVDAVQSVDLANDALINEVDVDYFDFDKVGYVRTATEVSSDNSALMRNVRVWGKTAPDKTRAHPISRTRSYKTNRFFQLNTLWELWGPNVNEFQKEIEIGRQRAVGWA